MNSKKGERMSVELPKYLSDVLLDIINNSGDDINFALGHLPKSTASSYVSKLKRLGMAYTHGANGTIEVWPTAKGIRYFQTPTHPRKG